MCLPLQPRGLVAREGCCCSALSPGPLAFLSFLFFSRAFCYSGLSLAFPRSVSLLILLLTPPLPPHSHGQAPCTMNMRVKMRFCSKFPVQLARQPLGSLPTFCKSSPANQNSCRQSPDPEFPDKEMFMLPFFLSDLSLYAKSGGWKKTQAPRWIMRVAAGAYGYVRCIVCLITRTCMFD